MSHLSALLACFAAAACITDPIAFTLAFAERACAPNDGPAILVTLSMTSGSVRLGPISGPDALTGSVDLEFATRGRVKGSFQATWRNTTPQCG